MGGPESSGIGADAGWRPIVAGAVAGSAMVLVGHPFDTTKVRMQASSASRYRSTLHCLRETVMTEGASALYKGLSPAILTTCLTSGLRFGVQHEFNTRLATHMSAGSDDASFRSLPVAMRVLAEGGGGAACGAVLPLVYTPMELVKCRRQVASSNALTNVQIARQVWRESGLLGLYTGHTLTVARSTLGNATLFGSFEGWKAVLLAMSGRERSTTAQNACAGVLSGWTTQLVCFPIDAAKSRQQVATVGIAGSSHSGGLTGLVHGLLALQREGALYRGLGAMLLRAIPVHMVYMPTYSLVLAAIGARVGKRSQKDVVVPRLRRTHSDF